MTAQTKPALLNAGRVPAELVDRLHQHYTLRSLPPAGAEREAFLAAHGAAFVAMITSSGIGADQALIAALPNLRVISNFGVGLDKLDLPAAYGRGVAVGHTPDVLNDCVADMAFTLLLDVARGASLADRFVRSGAWPRGNTLALTRKVSGAKLGVVGMGRIGQAIAKRSTGFEMDVRYHTRRPVAGLPWAHEPSLHALAQWCDFLVLITAGGAATRHLVDASVLEALGPEGFLVNVARGTVVDEAALVQALQERRIAGAGLDVFENEPQVPEALFALDNVVLVPHVASATRETRQAMSDLVFDNLTSYFQTGQLLRPAAV